MIDEIKNLEEMITHYAEQYYIGAELVSDKQFDDLVEELRKLDPNSPVLTKVGWGIKTGKSHHFGKILVGSLSKKQFGENWEMLPAICTPKLDGGSIVVYYDKGRLIKAVTRGDGQVGQNVTHKIGFLVPRKIPYQGMIGIRGEVFIPEKNFLLLKERGIPNPRNYANGIINRKENDSDIDLLMFSAYSVKCCSDKEFKSKIEILNFIKNQGFTVPDYIVMYEYNYEAVKEFYLNSLRMYPCDGLVFTEDNIRYSEKFDELNIEGFDIVENSIAYKFPGDQKETVVKNIEWTIGISNRINPVVEFDPVFLDGSTVTRASGYNYKFIKDNRIAVGSKITVRKANGIIPEIINCESNFEPEFPKYCPVCGSSLLNDETILYCNNISCMNKESSRILRFFEISGIPDGLSTATIDRLFSHLENYSLEDVINDILIHKKIINREYITKNIVSGHYGNLLSILAENCLIKLQKGLKLWEFYYILNLTNLGNLNSKKIKYFPDEIDENFDKIKIPVNALNSLRENLDLIKRIYSAINRNIIGSSDKDNESQIKIKVCYTGKTDKFKTRKEFFNFYSSILEESDIKKAEYLICNADESSSSKFRYAKENNIKILTEQEFRDKINLEFNQIIENLNRERV